MSIYNVLKENDQKTNYTKKNCSPFNNPSMNRGSFGSVHCTGNLSMTSFAQEKNSHQGCVK